MRCPVENHYRALARCHQRRLAYAFDQRRQTFLKPTVRWQWLFVGSVIAIVILAFSGLWNAYAAKAPLTYDELLRLWLTRLPIAAALTWLALYAGRESAMAKRLEEDYGYKSATASLGQLKDEVQTCAYPS